MDYDYPVLTSLLTINKLNFFVNTTIYNILEKKIKEGRNTDAISLNFSINSKMRNAQIDIGNSDKPVVFNFFGSLFNSPDPALTEEEMLEYTTLFISRMAEGADTILDELKNKSILFLGCSQPEWLIRFFMRVLVNERMNDWDRRRSTITIVSDHMNMNQRQYAFLKSHKVEIFEGNTAEFVSTLVDKWTQMHPPARKPKMIFLSYTQADVDAVQRVKQEIEKKVDGVICWYDKERIFSGDKFTTIIVDNIRKSCLFIPLISQNCVNRPDKYFSREWEWAYNQNIIRELDGIDKKFIMPVVIDETLPTEEIIAKFFSDVSIERVLGGMPDDEFINRLKENLND
ncbi:MAG: hypothetical protein AVDCRST_MAG96-3835 [uncultured Segetibacter sp.]|uniref:TIR domain-containing protein n=1 Tax=uncultured Segetibacter sp. TaxID=481133 RepID=A0A6J4TXM6_9BACT|nr:MAG: hypothetical protein AVDCRST_MAG96-3835 [uncultured Segetibacter sp.]